jgi:hypothetical protein
MLLAGLPFADGCGDAVITDDGDDKYGAVKRKGKRKK